MRALLVSLLFFPVVAIAQPAIDVFTRQAVLENVTISPEGTYIAFTGNEDGIDFISVILTEDQSPVLEKRGFGEEFNITSYVWATDGRLVVTASPGLFGGGPMAPGQIFAMDANGENFEVLMGVDRSGGGSRIRANEKPQSGRLIDVLPEDSERIMVTDAPFGFGPNPPRNTAYYADINTGRLTEIIGSPVANGNFITDREHELRYVSGFQSDLQVLFRLSEDEEWVRIADSDDDNWFVPEAAISGNRMLVRTTGENSTSGYSVWDLESNSVSPLFQHDMVDAGGLLKDEDNNIWAIEYQDHYPEYAYLNQEHPYAQLHINLRRALSAFDVKIVDATEDFSKAVIYVNSPQNPGEYLLLDTQEMQYLMRVASQTDFPADQTGRMDPFELTARDGTLLRGYLTLPSNGEERNLPMVVLPHDGPHNSFDTWQYDPAVQVLASRGYAVLQVNYRGSAGRGMNFMSAGYGEWGGAMQDDVIDAVNWAINDGVADPDRICIEGTGYGGYVALTAVFQEPGMFQCAVGISGIYDLALLADGMEQAGPRMMDPGLMQLTSRLNNDASLLASRSPAANADKISADVMLVHDNVNFMAPFEHAENMKAALESAGNDVVWLVETDSNEAVITPDTIADVYAEVLEFIEDSIGD